MAAAKRTHSAQERTAPAIAAPAAPDAGTRARRVRAVLALALDFRTWQRLTRNGLDDGPAADLMADLVACTASAHHQ